MNPAEDPLSQLRDIVEPASVAWWPIAPGWWALALLTLAIFFAVWGLLRRRRRRAAHWSVAARAALTDLAADQQQDDKQWLASLAVLIRRISLAAEPRETVSALTGDAWLARLDDLAGGDGFRRGVGRHLTQSAWQKSVQLAEGERAALIALASKLVAALDDRGRG